MGIVDPSQSIWGTIFIALVVALLIALRLADLRRKATGNRKL
jgi:hypothetical protein